MKEIKYIEWGKPYRHLSESCVDIEYAEYEDGTPLTPDEIEELYSEYDVLEWYNEQNI